MKNFLTEPEEQAVVEEIRRLEERTSCELRIFITSRWIFRPERHAWKIFHRLGMTRTAARNAALIVVFPRRRRFVVLGDSGLNAVVEADYWERIAKAMSDHLREGRRTEALATGIRMIGETMEKHWPPGESNPDELPNDIAWE